MFNIRNIYASERLCDTASRFPETPQILIDIISKWATSYSKNGNTITISIPEGTAKTFATHLGAEEYKDLTVIFSFFIKWSGNTNFSINTIENWWGRELKGVVIIINEVLKTYIENIHPTALVVVVESMGE